MQGAGPDKRPAGETQNGRVHASTDALPGLEMRLRVTAGPPLGARRTGPKTPRPGPGPGPSAGMRMTMYKAKQKVARGNNVYPWLFSYSMIHPKNTPFRKKHPLYI